MIRTEDMIEAYLDCRRNKRRTASATAFEADCEAGIVRLTRELNAHSYHPGKSIAFVVTRPRAREVFAADFRDRVVHHWMCLRLTPLLEARLSPRRFNCRKDKGTLYGIETLTRDMRNVSENYTRDCLVARGDIKGFFMSIDKTMLAEMTDRFICENYEGYDKEDLRRVSRTVITHSPEMDCELHSPRSLWRLLSADKSLFTNGDGKGLPIGNLPSQTLANLLLMYAVDRVLEDSGMTWGGYVDDFYVISRDKTALLGVFPKLRTSLARYGLTLHPKKFYCQHAKKGLEFTGVIVKPGRRYTASRTVRSFKRAVQALANSTSRTEAEHALSRVNSYMGMLVHHDTYAIRRAVLTGACIYGACYVQGRFTKVSLRRNADAKRGRLPRLALAEPLP